GARSPASRPPSRARPWPSRSRARSARARRRPSASGACCAPSPATTGPGSTRWSRTRPPSRTSPTGASCSSPSRATGTRSSRRRSSLSSRCCGRRDVAARPTGTTVRELLAAAPAAHRRSVAAGLGAGDASAAALSRALGDDLAGVVAALAPQARAAATALAFASPVYAGPRAAVLVELERHGLAFAFGDRWSRRYVVPADLEAPLREVRAAAHAGPVAAAREPAAQRWVAAPAQTAHDAAALWAFLAQAPVRVKADGELYARAWPKL